MCHDNIKSTNESPKPEHPSLQASLVIVALCLYYIFLLRYHIYTIVRHTSSPRSELLIPAQMLRVCVGTLRLLLDKAALASQVSILPRLLVAPCTCDH